MCTKIKTKGKSHLAVVDSAVVIVFDAMATQTLRTKGGSRVKDDSSGDRGCTGSRCTANVRGFVWNVNTNNRPYTHYSSFGGWPALALCFGRNVKSAGTGPSSISDSFTQSDDCHHNQHTTTTTSAKQQLRHLWIVTTCTTTMSVKQHSPSGGWDTAPANPRARICGRDGKHIDTG